MDSKQHEYSLIKNRGKGIKNSLFYVTLGYAASQWKHPQTHAFSGSLFLPSFLPPCFFPFPFLFFLFSPINPRYLFNLPVFHLRI